MATVKRKTGRYSKNRGSSYERELAEYIGKSTGLNVRRALLSGGGRNDGGADLDGTPMIHVEAKRTNRLQPYAAMQQAEESIARSKTSVVPVVISRMDRIETGDSLVVMRLDDWLEFYKSTLIDQMT